MGSKNFKRMWRVDAEGSLTDLSAHAREVWELLEPLEHDEKIPVRLQYQIGGIGRLAKQLECRIDTFSAGLLPMISQSKKAKNSGGAA
ncbi:MAG: hypothetical protein ACPGSM_20470 [Thiolinea sp.]